jgi:putative DNA primase/helicase
LRKADEVLRAAGVANGTRERGNGARPVIVLSPDFNRTVDEAVVAIARGTDLYQRDGRLVRIVRLAETEMYPRDHGELATAGTPQIRDVVLATLREHLARTARFQRGRAKADSDPQYVPPPRDVAEAVAARAEWPGVRPIAGISETHIVRPDLSVVTLPGYDAATGLVYLPGREVAPIPEWATEAEACQALRVLAEPFADFPFRGEADRYVSIAALLTLVARSAIPGAVPAFVLDASTRGSGKTLQADVIAMVATGRPAARMTWTSDDVETEKVLGAYALRASPLVVFDNVTATFGGAPLDRVLTANDRVELRVLGRSEIPALPWRAVVIATGNNVDVRGDTTRRVLLSRLEPTIENPEERTDFRHPDLLAWVRQEQAQILRAAVIVLRAWDVAGRPDSGCRPWGSFEAWSRTIPPAIVYAGGKDPMLCRIGVGAEGDTEAATLRVVLDGLQRIGADRGVTARGVVGLLWPAERLRAQSALPPDEFDDLREVLEGLTGTTAGRAPDTRRLGHALRRFKGRVLNGRRLEGTTGHAGTLLWTVRRVA